MSHRCGVPVADRAHALQEGRVLPDPGVALPPEHAAALRSALRNGETHYSPRIGLPELRAAVAGRLEQAGAPAGGTVVITAGRQEALFVALAGALAEARGDRRVSLSPSLANDPGVLAACAGLDLVPSGEGGAVRVAAPAEAEPEGAFRIVDLGDGLLREESDLASLPSDAVLVGSLDGIPELASFRVGFFRAPAALLPHLRAIRQAISICAASPSQRAAALVLGAGAAPAEPLPSVEGDDARYSLMELAARLPGVVSLGRGDPDADAPEAAIDAACDRIGKTEPLEPRGQRWLREAVAAREAERTGLRHDPDSEVLVTGGAQEGITLAMLALVGEGEEVLLGDPRYASYGQAIALARGRMTPVPCGGDGDFGLRAAEVRRALLVAERPRLLVIVNFQNPTGARTRAGEVEALGRLADAGHLWVLSDEVYADLALDGEGPIRSPAALPGLRSRTLTLGSVSKSYAMTGFRIGYLTGPADAIAACARARTAVSGPPPLFSQRAAAAALALGDAFPARLREIYAPRRRLLLDGLAALGIPCAPHGGGFFVWADISRFGLPADRFCRRLLVERRVLAFPGTAFGERWDRYIRVSMLQPEDRLTEALDRIAAFAR